MAMPMPECTTWGEKRLFHLSTSLLPLIKDDDNFKTAAPLLFGEFTKQSKEYMDQVKVIRSTLLAKTKTEHPRKPFFQRPPPSKRGGDRNKGWDSNSYRSQIHSRTQSSSDSCSLRVKDCISNCPTTVCTSVTCTYIKSCTTSYTDDHCSHGHNPSQHSKYAESASRTTILLPQKLRRRGTGQGRMGPRNSGRLKNSLLFGPHPATKTMPSPNQSESNSTHSSKSQRTSK